MANFNFYLNRQGVRGNKGEKGDAGFAPIVEVDTNTAAEYKLKIITEAGELITDNLRGSAVTDNGGTYMRYDPETQAMYAAPADRASENEAGIVYLADDSAMQQFDIYSAVTPKKLVDNLPFYFKSSDNSIIITQDQQDYKIDLRADVGDVAGDISQLEARMSTNEILLGSHQISINNLDRDKVDKVAGKGLSTNDFTNADKDKLDSSLQPTSVDGTTIGLNAGGQLTLLAQIPTVPTNISAFTNDSGYITGITSPDIIAALGYTPYDSSNPNGYTSNVGTVTSVNNVSPVSGNVTISIPTDTSDLTNGAGFISSVPTATTSSLGLVQPDGTTITINNGVISSSGGSTPSNMVTTDTSQTITGTKTFQNSNLILGTSTYSKFNLTNTYGDALRSESSTSTGLMHFAYNNYQNVATVSANRTNIDGSIRGLLRILPTTVYNHPETEGYIMTHNLVDMSYKPYLTVGKITSTGGTVAITDNGINGINIEAAGGSTPTNMVTTDTEQTISGHKIFSDTSTEIAGDLYITQSGTSYIRMGDNSAYATPVLTMDDTNDVFTVGDTGKFLKLKAYDTVVISNNRGNELTVGYDTLTYKKSDDTVVDLLALEARIAALEAQINGGNA